MNYKMKYFQLVIASAFLFCCFGLNAQTFSKTELVFVSTNTDTDVSFYELVNLDLDSWSELEGLSTLERNRYFMNIDGVEVFSYSPIHRAKIEIKNNIAEEIFKSVFNLSPETIIPNLYQN